MEEEIIRKKPIIRRNLILGGEEPTCYIFDTRKGSIYTLNETALSIVKLCDGKHTIRDVINNLIQTYDVEENVVIDDVLEFINDLIVEGIIRCQD